ncbi:hypothetical protein Tco_0003644 [Tanacetum coccineum]
MGLRIQGFKQEFIYDLKIWIQKTFPSLDFGLYFCLKRPSLCLADLGTPYCAVMTFLRLVKARCKDLEEVWLQRGEKEVTRQSWWPRVVMEVLGCFLGEMVVRS